MARHSFDDVVACGAFTIVCGFVDDAEDYRALCLVNHLISSVAVRFCTCLELSLEKVAPALNTMHNRCALPQRISVIASRCGLVAPDLWMEDINDIEADGPALVLERMATAAREGGRGGSGDKAFVPVEWAAGSTLVVCNEPEIVYDSDGPVQTYGTPSNRLLAAANLGFASVELRNFGGAALPHHVQVPMMMSTQRPPWGSNLHSLHFQSCGIRLRVLLQLKGAVPSITCVTVTQEETISLDGRPYGDPYEMPIMGDGVCLRLRCPVSVEAAELLVAHLPNLRALRLWQLMVSTPSAWEDSIGSSRLERLEINRVVLADSRKNSLELPLHRFPALTLCSVGQCRSITGLTKPCPSLLEMTFVSCHFHYRGVIEVSPAIRLALIDCVGANSLFPAASVITTRQTAKANEGVMVGGPSEHCLL